jgi:MFS family permease
VNFSQRGGAYAVVNASGVATVAALPVFLVGAVAAVIQEHMVFTEAQIGLAISGFFGAAALMSVSCAHHVARVGSTMSLAISTLGSGAAMLGIAVARNWLEIAALLVFAGCAHSLAQVAANEHVARSVSDRHHGVAFGVKQSAVPTATLVGGVAVPTIAVKFGWRWVFFGSSTVALILGLIQCWTIFASTQMSRPEERVASEEAFVASWSLAALALGHTFAACAATAMASFIAIYGFAAGINPAWIGASIVTGSIGGVLTRVGIGWVSDQTSRGGLFVVALMLALGSGALFCFPLVHSSGLMILTTLMAYGLGWGWPGLLNLAVVRHHAAAPAAATAVTQIGAYVGGVVGPFTFGFLVSVGGFGLAWPAAGASMALASVIVLLVARTWRKHGN